MSNCSLNSWQDVQREVMRRLHSRVWKPGDLLPGEIELASEFGCARSTVNRALQAIAEAGFLERRRRGGTRVLLHPERKAKFSIPVIRLEIEQQNRGYQYELIARKTVRPTGEIRNRFNASADARFLHLRAMHFADDQLYVLEERWIDLTVVPAAAHADFKIQSANEWLVENIPYSGGELTLSATSATSEDAELLKCKKACALFTTERLTHDASGSTITLVRLVFAPDYKMQVEL